MFTYILMPQPYGTIAKPLLFNVPGFGGRLNFYSLREGVSTRWGAQFGHGKDGTPAKGEVAWSDPDKFNNKYEVSDYMEAPTVDGYDFIDPETGDTLEGRLLDGFIIPGRTVWKAQQQHFKNAASLNKKKAQDEAKGHGTEFWPVSSEKKKSKDKVKAH